MQTLQPVVGNAARGERGRAAVRLCALAASRAHPLPQRRARLVVAARVSRAAVAAAAAPEEVLKAYQRLQNGSDVRGVALPGVAGQDVTLSPERCAQLCAKPVTQKRATDPRPRAALWLTSQRRLHRASLRRLARRQDGPPRVEAARFGTRAAIKRAR